MKKARVKKDACIGCGLCTSIASEIFAFGDDGLAQNVLGDNTDIPEEVQANVQEAADSCPTGAIETE